MSSQWIRGRVSVFPSSLFGLLRRGVVPRPPSLPPSDLLSLSGFLRGCVFSPGGQGPLRMGICTGVEYSCTLLAYIS